ncbi:MAG: hypothetical protein DRP74_06515 [Candidatus Omnitrophota bacterium]|nr:MAG: hypothetical protein DRP74_06515 [Candidatus Omnitrophota bacterium]
MKSKTNLDITIQALNKKFGTGTIVRGQEVTEYLDIERVSTGVFALDLALGGGLPKGRIVEIYGELGSGKSLISLLTAAQISQNGGQVVLLDLEKSFDKNWAAKLGVNIDQLLITQPDSAEQASDIIDSLVRSREVDLLIVDSVATFSTMREQDESSEDQQMGDTAKLTNKLMRKITAGLQPLNLKDPTTYNKCIVLFINQLREKIGVLYGNPETTPGGRGLPFHASIRIQMKLGSLITKKEEILGRVMKFKVTKNKVAPPYKMGEFDFYLSGRVDNFKSIILSGISLGIIQQNGPYYSIEGQKYLGKDKLIEDLRQNKEFEQTLIKKIKQLYLK